MDNHRKSEIRSEVEFKVSNLHGFNKGFLAFCILKYEYNIQGFSLSDFHKAAKENIYDDYYKLDKKIINCMINKQ